MMFHPDYGMTDEFRHRVLDYAEHHGIAAAAAVFNVSTRAIYQWKARYLRDNT